MVDVYQYALTAAGNDIAPPNGWQTGMGYDLVDNTGREMMAADARDLADLNGTLTTAGFAPAYTLTLNRSSITAYQDGLRIGFTAHASNAGATTTINVNGIGFTNLVLPDGSAPTLVGGGVYQAIYFAAAGGWQLTSVTTPEKSLNTFANVTTDRVLAPGDVEGPILRVATSAIVRITAPNFTVIGPGSRVRICNTEAASFNFLNNTAGTVYRSDSTTPIANGNTVPLTAPFYTFFVHQFGGGGLLLDYWA